MKKVNKDQALKLMQNTDGKTFSAVFTKKDGSKRLINCRVGVSKGVTGVGMKYNALSHGLFTVYDMNKRGFRQINLNTLESIQIKKQTFVVVE